MAECRLEVQWRGCGEDVVEAGGRGPGEAAADDAVVTQSHLPEQIADMVYYRHKDSGYEKTIKERQQWLNTQKTGKGKSKK